MLVHPATHSCDSTQSLLGTYHTVLTVETKCSWGGTKMKTMIDGRQWRIQGRARPLVLDQTEAQRAKKNFFGDWAPTSLI